jgi:hypothetical protein
MTAVVNTVVNTDVNTRVWPRLQLADGHTLELGPGEAAEIDLPAGFEDPYLKPVVKAKAKGRKVKTPDPPADEPAAATELEEQKI